MASSLVDEETRQLILKKTWCHGQLVLPAFSLLYLWLVVSQGYNAVVFLYAAIIFPVWSYYSYKGVATATVVVPLRPLLMGGALVELAHIGVLSVVMKDLSTSINMLLLVASGLFLIETVAFLCVVTFLREPTNSSSVNRNRFQQEHVGNHREAVAQQRPFV